MVKTKGSCLAVDSSVSGAIVCQGKKEEQEVKKEERDETAQKVSAPACIVSHRVALRLPTEIGTGTGPCLLAPRRDFDFDFGLQPRLHLAETAPTSSMGSGRGWSCLSCLAFVSCRVDWHRIALHRIASHGPSQ